MIFEEVAKVRWLAVIAWVERGAAGEIAARRRDDPSTVANALLDIYFYIFGWCGFKLSDFLFPFCFTFSLPLYLAFLLPSNVHFYRMNLTLGKCGVQILLLSGQNLTRSLTWFVLSPISISVFLRFPPASHPGFFSFSSNSLQRRGVTCHGKAYSTTSNNVDIHIYATMKQELDRTYAASTQLSTSVALSRQFRSQCQYPLVQLYWRFNKTRTTWGERSWLKHWPHCCNAEYRSVAVPKLSSTSRQDWGCSE